MKVKRSDKNILKTGVISGLFFAIWMSAFDYFDQEPFSIFKFLLGFIFFGGAMAYTFRYHYKSNNKDS
ncbi:MAG: hypothetical protein P8K68_13715 [Algibacter sp.]|uniref:hypothetical protein n=1 Tax=Algibacter sp. TaxID=1872428 RepID=UPI0026362E86|nr:hypothetical protein [Algibacter sp.]MDG1730082.1 hypothetical protein [Algibacter sp.]MDG2179824.1 hypothetical protein [Algibacter sp.]